jgi:hypothetical protein
MITTPLPRGLLAPRTLAIVAVAFAVMVIFAASTTVLDPPMIQSERADVRPVPTAQTERAALVADAADELADLGRTVRVAPATADALHDRIALLRLAIDGRVPTHAVAPQP